MTTDDAPRPGAVGTGDVGSGTAAPSGADGPRADELAATIRAAVTGRRPVDERERAGLERFVDEFDRLVGASLDPFAEAAGPVHVTASAIVVGRRGVVLHRHKRLGIWLQPGGHIDPGESPWTAAAREASEETGLVVRPLRCVDGVPELVHVDVHPGPRGHVHLDLRYLFDGGDAEPAPAAGESQDVAWFDWDEAITLADPGLRGALRSLRP